MFYGHVIIIVFRIFLSFGFVLLFLRPTIRHFCSLFKVRRVVGAKIMTSIEYVEKSWHLRESKSSAQPFLWLFFTSDHQTFCSLFKVRRNVIGCINHDIVDVVIIISVVVVSGYFVVIVVVVTDIVVAYEFDILTYRMRNSKLDAVRKCRI